MSTSRISLLALLLASGCALVDDNGLSAGSDGTLPTTDLLAADVAQGGNPDFATSPDYDAAMATSTDLGTNLQVCDLHTVRVNEVATQGPGGAGDEFIELYNPCAGQVSLSGVKLVYRSYNGTTDSSPLWAFTTETIAPKGFFVVANTAFAGTANAKPFQTSPNGALASTGGGVGLRDSASTLIDSVGWGSATNVFVENTAIGAPSATQSAARTSDGVDTNNNLADFSLGTPTPGATN